MKTKNKGKLEYVEQFRKITAIQKLPTLKQGFGDIFFQNKAQNNKFLRLKDQVILSEIQLNCRLHQMCQNQYIREYINDSQQLSRKNVDSKIVQLNDQISSYKQWAKDLTDFVQEGKYVYRFRSHTASPPIALAKEMLTFDPLAMELANDTGGKKGKNAKNKPSQVQNQTVSLPNRVKKRFDFGQITDYLITDDYKLEDLDGNIDLAKRQFQNFRPFKTIYQINQIQQLKVDYDKFEYNAVDMNDFTDRRNRNNDSDLINSFNLKQNSSFVDDQPNNGSASKKNHGIELPQLLKPSKTHYQRFKHLSLLRNIQDININFFRNIGPPSRYPQEFIKHTVIDQNDSPILQEDDNPLTRQKIDTCLLHFLEPNQLKVNKNTLNFYDIENISMSRITSTNAHMCIRSEKVTRLQYEKLLKKMEKLYKLQHEDGKTRVNQAVSTDEFEQESGNPKNSKNDGSHNRLSLNKIVEEINAIRKQAYVLQNVGEEGKPYKFINERLVKDQMAKKMFSLLEQLYRRVCEDLPFNYSILEIGLHVDEVNGLAEEQFEKKKLIWFIMTVLQEIQKGKSLEKNISYLQNKNKKDEDPKVIKYRGDKVVARDKMGAKNLYYNNPNNLTTNKDKSVSQSKYNQNTSPSKTNYNLNPKTPLKNNNSNLTPNKVQSKSPLKSNITTQQKKPNNNLTPTRTKSPSALNGSTAKKIFRP